MGSQDNSVAQWTAVCTVDEIGVEEVLGFQHNGADYAIYRSPEGEFFATAGHCTHEETRLCQGLVMEGVIECPRHYGQFDYRTGEALGAPVFINLKTYPVKVEDKTVYISVE